MKINTENITQCVSCRACEQKCPKNAITMIENLEGFLFPRIDELKCIDCGLCYNSCPINYVFEKPKYNNKQNVVIRFGTIIGLDTKKAKLIGQNKIAKVYSSPAEIFVNGNRIGTLEINGDNQEILIPKNLLKEKNELVIKTGRNLFQTEYIDYDDIELANIRVEIKERQYFARD
jgi:ferredoxin